MFVFLRIKFIHLPWFRYLSIIKGQCGILEYIVLSSKNTILWTRHSLFSIPQIRLIILCNFAFSGSLIKSRIIQCVAFYVWLLNLACCFQNIHVAACSKTSFFFSFYYLAMVLYGCTTFCESIHQLVNISIYNKDIRILEL